MSFHGTLHPYQVDDKNAIVERGRILVAYGQGTGKTVMTIAALEEAMDEEIILEPGLIICPSSLKDQWAQAIHRWTGGELRIDAKSGLPRWTGGESTPLVITGTGAQRAALYDRARDWKAPGGPDYVILGYEQVVNDWSAVRKLPRGFVVCDEATAIKGFRSQRSKRVKRLQSEFKIGLTGTPIENGRPEELFSVMQWIDEDVLGRWDMFDKTFIVRNGFGGVKRYRNIPLFLEIMEKAMVRRTRKDPEVAPYFPEVDVDKPPLEAELDPAARKVYKHVAGELVLDLREAMSTGGSFDIGQVYGVGDPEGNDLRGRIAQKRMVLQMLCDHPDLIRQSAQRFVDYIQGKGPAAGSAYAAELVGSGMMDKVAKTPKMDRAVAWVLDVLERDERNKVVVFSTYVETLRLFQERLPVESVTFHGGLNEKQKTHAIGTFKHDPKCRVFLSSDAGGYGIDLPEANYLLNYSLPDKWGATDQRETRIVRASSEFDVVQIRRILVAGALEVLKYQRLVMKGKVADAFLEGRGVDGKGRLANDVGSLIEYLTSCEAGDLQVAA